MFGRRLKICSITKNTRHQFDPVTHQCGCGAWERGYTPAKESVKPRAECQICERMQAVSGGLMMNHGYQRPGIGFIVGKCMGTDHQPYPATDALVKYLEAVKRHIESDRETLAEIPTMTEVMCPVQVGYGRSKKIIMMKARKGDHAHRDAETGGWVNGFMERLAQIQREAEQGISQGLCEVDRVEKRIKAATAPA